LPTLDIAEGALNTLWETYKRMLPTLGGFMTDEGRLDARRLELMLEQIGLKEAEVLSERAKAAEDFAEKNRKGSSFDVDVDEEDEVDAAMTALAAEGDDDDDDADTSDPTFAVVTKKVVKKEPEMMNSARRRMMLQGEGGLRAWRASYYADKMGVTTLDTPTVTQLAHNYLEGIMWVLEYYYRGVVSWTWFYPYHYAPMASDMKRLESFRQRFQYGKPFLPFHQLMAVLPPASMRLIPPALRPLMLDSSSPILDFYPLDFDQDHEGKRNDWEAVVLVPFIDEKRLLTHVDSVDAAKFTAAERRRNKLGVVLTFTFDMDGKGIAQSTLPGKLSSVNPCLSKVVSAPPPEPLQKAQPGFQPKLLEGTVTGAAGPPGFASLRTLKVSPRLYMAGVNVFGTASKKDSLVLQLRDPGDDNERLTAARVAAAALGKRCHVQWPFLVEALVVAVSDAKERVEGGSAMSAALLGRRSGGGGGQVRKPDGAAVERARLTPIRY
jgi:5'-3' exoribonuclease 1